jgi:hypothetical protein
VSRAHLDLTLLGPDGLPAQVEADGVLVPLVLKPVVTGFHVPDRTGVRHRFVPSLAFPGRDQCGYVVGWMAACGQPKVADLHRRRTSSEVRGEHVLAEAAAGRANIVELRIPGLNA